MTTRESIRKELDALKLEGWKLASDFHKKEDKSFHIGYQRWYTKALKAVSSLAPDRHAEFRSYYEVDIKRKTLGYETYVIQDFFKNVAPNPTRYPDFDVRSQLLLCFMNQLAILEAVEERLDSVLANIEGELYADIQESGVATARKLAKVSLRAAGALIGVFIEGHLQKVALARGIKVSKKNPTIADFNESLKSASVINIPTWRKISYLADIRNICSHNKEVEPLKEQVDELIQGAEWLTKNVF